MFDFIRTNTGRIEVARDGELFREYFIRRPTCNFLSAAKKFEVMENVGRESQQMKVNDLMNFVPGIIDEMEHNEKL